MKRIYSFLLGLCFSQIAFAQIKVSELPTATGNGAGGWIPIVQGGVTKKIHPENIAALGNFLSNITGYITAGTGVTISGSGTSGSPYNISTAAGGGTVTALSVASANGFTGTVANATTTPAITITTSITGLLKGNGTAISAAAAGTDYVSPTGTETLTNKTLTSPVINTPTGIVKGDVGLGNVDNTSDATKNAATVSLTNKDLTSGTNTFPTFNQNTTGSAGSVANALSISAELISGGATSYNGSATKSIAVQTNSITNAMRAQMATLTIKGNNTGGTANEADLTVAQVNAILPVFTTTLNGLVPFSGGGTTNFLRADGTWAAAGGGMAIGGTVTSATAGSVFFAGTSGVLQQNNSNFFWDNTNYRLGIGVPSPSVTLDLSAVSSSSSTRLAAFYQPGLTAGNFAFASIGKANVSNQAAAVGVLYNATASTAFMCVVGDDPSANTGLFVQKGGNVGIMTNTPNAPLEVVGNIIINTSGANEKVIYTNSNSGSTGMIASSSPALGAANGPYFGMRGNTYSAIATQRGNLFFSAGNPSSPATGEGQIKFNTGNDITVMTITKDQAIGFGTSSPHASMLVDMVSTTKGFRMPTMTTTQRDAIGSPATLGQIANTTQGTINTYNGTNWTGGLTTSSAGTLTLIHGYDYVFTGTTTTWTLPAVSSSTVGRQNAIWIKNIGSGSITLNSNAGSTLYTTSAQSSITIAAGAAVTLLPDGTYFNVQYNL